MDYDKLIAPAAQAMRPSGIRKFFDLAAEMPECISLGVGEPDFKTPWAVREAGIESLEHGRTRYTSNAGLKELRAEISRYLERRMGLRYDPMRQILVTVGGSEAIDMCIRTLIQPGDEVIIPEPCFVCYEPITTLSGGVPVHVACRQEDEFRLRADALKAAITPRTKLVIMPFPNNPTGAVMEREDLEAVAEVLRDTNVMVLSDEIYAELNYGLRPHVSIASLPGMAERTIVVNGFSKSHAMTGWRMGYVCAPQPVIAAMTKLHQFGIMSAPPPSQYAAIEAMRNGDVDIEKMRDEYDGRRRYLVEGLRRIGLPCFDGYHWCTEIRRVSRVPVIFISSAADNMNIIMAMNLGADDFIAKPFDQSVLMAKIQALLRRTYDFGASAPVLEHRGALLNTGDNTLTYQGQRVSLTKNEYRILLCLMQSKGRVVSREKLMERLWETDSFVDENTLTVNIGRLRKKLDAAGLPGFITTRVGLGYMVG